MTLMILSKDFQALREVAPDSQPVERDGKIYWRVHIPGVTLGLDEREKLTANGVPIETLVKNLLAERAK